MISYKVYIRKDKGFRFLRISEFTSEQLSEVCPAVISGESLAHFDGLPSATQVIYLNRMINKWNASLVDGNSDYFYELNV